MIVCEWCGDKKKTSYPHTKYCCDQHRVYGNREQARISAMNAENVTAGVVTE